MTFYDELMKYDWDAVRQDVYNRGEDDVLRALRSEACDLAGLVSLLSPAADSRLEDIAVRAQALTERRFGRVISLYAPLYLSSKCSNSCAYCSFQAGNPIDRVTLTPGEVEAEGKWLRKQGFRHILLVSGEDRSSVGMEYLSQVVSGLRPVFDSITIEIHPLETAEYERLGFLGVDGLAVYQETYNPDRYIEVHRAGPKKDFRWRIETPDRGGQAGLRKIGLGALLGLCDWRIEAVYLGMHARYLMKRFWRSQLAISFPRLRPAVGGYSPPAPVSDRDLVHMMMALRLFLPDAGLLISTRESPEFRDNVIPLGVTSMSAGSRTEPGGYTLETAREGQFEISDHRTPAEIAGILKQKGYEPVWKDWDVEFIPPRQDFEGGVGAACD